MFYGFFRGFNVFKDLGFLLSFISDIKPSTFFSNTGWGDAIKLNIYHLHKALIALQFCVMNMVYLIEYFKW